MAEPPSRAHSAGRTARRALAAGALLLLLVHHFGFFYGHFGYDDLHYARLATRLLDGSTDWGDHYAYRLALTGPLAVLYALFGVSDFVSALPALLSSAGLVLALAYFLRERPPWVYLLALALFFSLRWNLFYSDKIMTDVLVGAAVFGAWVAYWRARFAGARVGPSAALAATLLFVAFNAKGTIILVVPLFVVYLLLDWRAGFRRWWLVFAPAVGVMLLLYFGLTARALGDPLARFAAIDANHYLNECSYDELPWAHLRDRLTTGFLELLLNSRLIVHLLIGLVAGLAWLGGRGRGSRAGEGRLLLTVAVCFLSANFMTISPTSYNPVCLDERHHILFSGILSASAAALVGALFPAGFVRRRGGLLGAVLLLAVAALLYPTLRQAAAGPALGYRRVRAEFRQLLGELPRPVTVYGNEALRNYADYWTGFASDPDLSFANLNALPDCNAPATPADDRRRLLLSNWYVDWHGRISRDSVATALDRRGLSAGPPAEYGTESITVRPLACRP